MLTVRAAQEEIVASEARDRLLFEHNPQPMWVYDTETLAFLDVNEAESKRCGYSKREFLSLALNDIWPPDEVPAMMANARDYSEAGAHRSL
jgi:PAS domain S-box-containing protein